MNERHLKLLRFVQKKAFEGLRSYPLATAMEAVRSLEMAIRNERVILGEPADRSAVSLEEVIRREHERWLIVGGKGSHDARDQDGDAPAGDDAQ
jgi:hypothetical protein